MHLLHDNPDKIITNMSMFYPPSNITTEFFINGNMKAAEHLCNDSRCEILNNSDDNDDNDDDNDDDDDDSI